MDRLARMLAESTAPPSPRARLIEELLAGNFESLGDVAAGQQGGQQGGTEVE